MDPKKNTVGATLAVALAWHKRQPEKGNREGCPNHKHMLHEIDIKLLPAEAKDETAIRRKAASKLQLREDQIQDLRVLRRSVDARSSQPIFLLRVAVYIGESYQAEPAILSQLKSVADRPSVLIVGAGPAGYFAALELIEQGLKPIVLPWSTVPVRTACA